MNNLDNMPNSERRRLQYENDILYGAAANYSASGSEPTQEELIAMRKNNKNYSAGIALKRGERTVYHLSGVAKSVIRVLNPPRERCKESNERLMYRTASGKHYRMAQGLAALLSVETVDQAGVRDTVPPTVLVTVDQTVGAIERYVAEVPLDTALVVESIRQMVALTPGNTPGSAG